MAPTAKIDEVQNTTPGELGGGSEATTPLINSEDIELAQAPKVTTEPKAQVAEKATIAVVGKSAAKKAMTLQDYVNAGEKPPVSMVDSPTKFKEYLLCFPKVKVIAPLSPGEKKGVALETVSINGVSQTFKKGMFIELPSPMADLVMNHYELADTNSIDTEQRVDNSKKELN